MLPIHERCRLPRSLRKRALLRRRLSRLRMFGEVCVILASALAVVAAMWSLIG